MKCLSTVLMTVALCAVPCWAQQKAPAAPRGPTTHSSNAEQDESGSEQQLVEKAAILQEDLRNLTGSKFMSSTLSERLTHVVMELDRLEIEYNEKRLRADLTARKIAQLTQEARDHAAQDAILNELNKLAEERAKDAERLQKMAESGVTPMAEAGEAASSAAEARVKAEERREALMTSVGGGIIPALNRDLVTLSIDADALSQTRDLLIQKRDGFQRAVDISLELLNLHNQLVARFHREVNVSQ